MLGLTTGHLRLDPNGLTGAVRAGRRQNWAVLFCDPGWYGMNLALAKEHLPGRWGTARDGLRPRVGAVGEGGGGSQLDLTPKLVFIKPMPEMPAWGPHVSLIRGEAPRLNLDVWATRSAVTMREQELERLDQQVAAMVIARDNLVDTIDGTAPSKREKFRREQQALLQQKNVDIGRAQSARPHVLARLREAENRWNDIDQERFPAGLRPARPLTFEVTSALQTGTTHWWYEIHCAAIEDLRSFFGLAPLPRIPLHLTVGVMPG